MTLRHSILAAILLLLAACGTRSADDAPRGNAVYYWRTVLKLSEAERSFLDRHRVEAVYLRMFDVDRGADGRLRPVSTLLFADTLPSGLEVIPVVFITPTALADTTGTGTLAADIVDRVTAMMVKNGYGEPRELQLDFDWTARNADRYFALLRQASGLLRGRGARLSVTVRLHQLAMTPPPADYGVLMMYNTGSFTDPDEHCSILSEKTAAPYLHRLKDYRLPLCTALPVYSWDLVFDGREFRFIARGIDLSDTTLFRHVSDNLYRCIRYMAAPMAANADNMTGRIYPGYRIRHEEPEQATVTRLAEAIRSTRPDAMRRVIIYHLDEQSINRYETEFFSGIYGRPAGRGL